MLYDRRARCRTTERTARDCNRGDPIHLVLEPMKRKASNRRGPDSRPLLEYRVLSALREPCDGKKLGERLASKPAGAVSTGSMFVVLGRLREAGLIESMKKDGGDGRLRTFHLTPEGKVAQAESAAFYRAIAIEGDPTLEAALGFA